MVNSRLFLRFLFRYNAANGGHPKHVVTAFEESRVPFDKFERSKVLAVDDGIKLGELLRRSDGGSVSGGGGREKVRRDSEGGMSVIDVVFVDVLCCLFGVFFDRFRALRIAQSTLRVR